MAMREALAFLTPLGGARKPSPGALAWFGPVGALLGLCLGGLWWTADRLWPAPLAAAIVVAADLALTGLLHLDGLADAADGLLGHLGPERRLAVMAQSDVGAFGVGVVVVTLLVRWAALAALGPAPLLLVALWCASRAAMAIAVATLPYARRGGGLVSAFCAEGDEAARFGGRVPSAIAPVGALAGALGLVIAWRVPAGPVALVVALVAFSAVLGLAKRRLGGFTGDVLGAAGLVAESIGLLSAAARW
jgi:adenosylcobinamide-GDP ribazoletransferase